MHMKSNQYQYYGINKSDKYKQSDIIQLNI